MTEFFFNTLDKLSPLLALLLLLAGLALWYLWKKELRYEARDETKNSAILDLTKQMMEARAKDQMILSELTGVIERQGSDLTRHHNDVMSELRRAS